MKIHGGSTYDGFPRERLQAAFRFLYAIKPWWSRYGERFTVVPISVPVPRDEAWGGMASTDEYRNLYIDRQFAGSAPLEVVAGAIEHCIQKHVRNSWNRLSWLDEDELERYRNVCIDMEIASALDDEVANVDLGRVHAICSASGIFTMDDVGRWSVGGPPSLGEHCWRPETLGLNPGESAETYYRRIRDNDPGNNSNEGEGEDEGETQESEDPSSEEASQGDVDPSSDTQVSANQSDPSEEEPDTSKDESDSQVESDPSDEGATPKDGTSEETNGPAPDSESDPLDDSPDSSDSEDESNGESDDTENPVEDKSTADNESEEGQDTDNEGTSSEDSKPEDSESESRNEQPTLDELMDSAKESSNALQWWADSIPQQGEETPWQKDADDSLIPSQLDEEQAQIELSQDISEAMESSWGLKPGAAMMEMATTILARRGMEYKSRLTRLLSSSTTNVKTNGGSDISYSYRNPNQQRKGPILMGLHDYAPNIYAIIDVSGSMRRYMGLSMSVLADLVQQTMGSYGDKVTWITVDAKVQDVGTTFRVTSKDANKIAVGFGGTVIGPTLLEVLDGTFTWKGRKYPRADLAFLLTDCRFAWPLKEQERLKRHGKIVVASVTPYDRLKGTLPMWLTPKEFVHIPPVN